MLYFARIKKQKHQVQNVGLNSFRKAAKPATANTYEKPKPSE